ncbi:MAG: hypothetical protein JXR18_15425 [Neptuniibacter sp.]
MSALTAEQARAIAKALRKLSSELGDFRFENWDQLNDEQRARIESLEWTLLNYSSDMTASAIEIATNNLTEPVAQIEGATAAIDEALGNINSVSSAINIATKTVTLAASIASGNVGAIKDAAQGLIEEFA